MIFISTGGFSNKKGTDAYQYLRKKGLKNIEFSGGTYIKNFNYSLNKYKSNTQIHNYFPPAKSPFVLNLSSKNKKISSKSFNFVKRNIKLSKKLGAKFYSFHAGFRVDPNYKELGKPINKSLLISKKEATEIFLKKLLKLNQYAKKNGIKLLIENKLISKKNLKKFNANPFLLTTPKEIIDFFNKLKKYRIGIGLLLDVAHLKVSSKTLKFNLQKGHLSLNKYISAYHLSDNDGITDSNKKFTKKAWFWKHFKKKTYFVTIEVYNATYKDYSHLVKIVQKRLNNE